MTCSIGKSACYVFVDAPKKGQTPNLKSRVSVMQSSQRPTRKLKGLSFDIADLILIRNRSEAHGLRVVVHLDHGSDVEEYEEVLTFHAETSPQCRWLMWRSASTVFVRPIDGRARRYGSVTRAIDAMVRKLHATSPDTQAKRGKPVPVRSLADLNGDTVAVDSDPYVVMYRLVEAAVYTLTTRVPADRQDDTAAALWQLLADRLEQRGSLR